MRTLALSVLSLVLAVPVLGQTGMAVNQNGAPITIDSVDTYTDGQRIYFEVSYRNLRDRSVTAVELGMVSLGPFGKRIGMWQAVDVDTLRSTGGAGWYHERTWFTRSRFSDRHYIALAYPHRVRFVGGEVWRADMEMVTDSARKMLERPDLTLPRDSVESVRQETEQI